MKLPVPLNHLGTGPLLAPPARGLLLAPALWPSCDLSPPYEEVPGSWLLSIVDELTRESPISGLEPARTDKTLKQKKQSVGLVRWVDKAGASLHGPEQQWNSAALVLASANGSAFMRFKLTTRNGGLVSIVGNTENNPPCRRVVGLWCKVFLCSSES